MYLSQSSKHTFLAPAEPAPERCISRIRLKALSWKSKMKHVVKYEVKYDVYLDILLMGSMYGIKYRLLKENPEIHTCCLNFQPML